MCHRCFGTVIRNIIDNGETWSTIGAIDEWIAKAAVIWVEEFLQTVRAGRDIR